MVKRKFDIQLFATDGDKETETPTEEVVTEEEKEASEDVEFSDSKDNSKSKEEASTEQKDEDASKAKEEADKKARNDANAKRRIEQRQREQQERERARIKNEGYVEGIKKATKGINPYTNGTIEDSYDVEIYEMMKKLDDEGKDPIEELPKVLAEQKRAEAKKTLEANAEKEKQFKDIQDLEAKYGRETVERLAQDKDFDDFSDGLVGKIPMTTIYEKYIKQQASMQAKAKDIALEKDARRVSSTGSNSTKEEGDFDFTKMSPEEFHKWSVEISKRR